MRGSSAAEAGRPGDLFLANLDRIDRIIGAICRRNGIAGDEADDVRSWLHMRLIDDDYAAFRKFGGRSSIATYLTVVVTNLFRDYRIHLWGKWRPSAEARRMGPMAVRLERLVHRDGCSLREAIEIMRSAGTHLPGDADIARLAARLPLRTARGRGAPLPIDVPAPDAADSTVREQQVRRERAEIEDAIETALRDLGAEDAVILRMRFWGGFTTADIARALHLDQKSLYPRFQRLLSGLRTRLEGLGVEPERVTDFLMETREPE